MADVKERSTKWTFLKRNYYVTALCDTCVFMHAKEGGGGLAYSYDYM